MSGIFEISVRIPELPNRYWLSSRYFTSNFSIGDKIKDGEVLGILNGFYGERVEIEIIAPVTGIITYLGQTPCKDRDLLFQIKSELAPYELGIGRASFKQLQDFFDKSSRDMHNDVLEYHKGARNNLLYSIFFVILGIATFDWKAVISLIFFAFSIGAFLNFRRLHKESNRIMSEQPHPAVFVNAITESAKVTKLNNS